MAVNPVSFQPLSFQQASPLTSGMQVGSEVMANAFKNALMRQQTAGQQITNQYLPATLQSDIGLKGGQTRLANAQADYYPYIAEGTLLNGAGRFAMGQNGMVANVVKLASTPAGMLAISKDPNLMSLYLQIFNQTSNRAANGATIPGMGTPQPNIPNAVAPNTVAPNTQQAPDQNQAPNVAPNLSNAAPQPLPQSPTQVAQLNSQMTPLAQNGDPTAATLANTQQPVVAQPASQQLNNQNLIAGMQDAENSGLQAKTVPKPILQQRVYAQSAENLIKQLSPDMATITSFAGAAGKANLTLDKYAVATGQQASPAYVKANNFLTTQMPILVNEVRRGLGGQATDSEREEMTNVANPVFWKNNPQTAIAQFNSLVDALHAVNQALVQSPSQTVSSLQQGIQNPPYAQQQISKSIGGKSYTKINGKWYQQ